MIFTKPDPYLLPSYRMSPFSTSYVSRNHNLPYVEEFVLDFFNTKFRDREWAFTETGRSALFSALSHYDLDQNDNVTILTTTGNKYISSCVTSTIEKFCQWSREITDKTKIVFVNHEFGYPFQGMEKIVQLGYPIVEDCAYSFESQDSKQMTGFYGDFTIYSLPKYFPIQIGGILTGKKKSYKNDHVQTIDQELKEHIISVLNVDLKDIETIRNERIENELLIREYFAEIDCQPRMPLDDSIVPGAFLFKCPNEWNLPELKQELSGMGIQCSVFYGERTFFLPNHQNLEKVDIELLYETVKLLSTSE